MALEYSGEARRMVCQALGGAFSGLEKAVVVAEPAKGAALHPRAGPGAASLSSKEKRRQVADTTISSKLVKKLLRNTRPRGDEDDPPVSAQRTDAGVDATAVPFWKKRRIELKRVEESEDEEVGDKFKALAAATATAKAKAAGPPPPAKGRRG
eukprot:EG_transcript_38583